MPALRGHTGRMNALGATLLTGVADPKLGAFSRFDGSWGRGAHLDPRGEDGRHPAVETRRGSDSLTGAGTSSVAEAEGFEPPLVLPKLAFKASAFGRSATLPWQILTAPRKQGITDSRPQRSARVCSTRAKTRASMSSSSADSRSMR